MGQMPKEGEIPKDDKPEGESSNTSPQSGKTPSSHIQPAAGPHAKPHLTNEEATPGAGSLADAGDPDATGSTGG
ncbi:hypothetical protein [Microvirga antarctica]|uniref:hypothetical protein n=1 Tax=Microvirga antarctica TaxID=2819233 RepID=UPI001B313AB8|nr:hypothetical protein [Microvirga antarctica]